MGGSSRGGRLEKEAGSSVDIIICCRCWRRVRKRDIYELRGQREGR